MLLQHALDDSAPLYSVGRARKEPEYAKSLGLEWSEPDGEGGTIAADPADGAELAIDLLRSGRFGGLHTSLSRARGRTRCLMEDTTVLGWGTIIRA